MLRVFHIPAHLDYVAKLSAADFRPTSAPSGQALTVAGLLTIDSWDFFDLLHLHTVELATATELTQLGEQLQRAGKRMVLTIHDLVPNIEDDPLVFDEKVQIAIKYASAIVTLTDAAAKRIVDRHGVRPMVIPHGYTVPPSELGRSSLPGRAGFLVFGAFRPNRDLLAVVRAWRLLSTGWPPLVVIARSVGDLDRKRCASEIATLKTLSHLEPDLSVEIHEGMLPRRELIDRCQDVTTLVLPYRTITHSGQLELALDMGLNVVAPDVPTLRAQVHETGHDEGSAIWFAPGDLDNERAFAEHLLTAASLSTPDSDRRPFLQSRTREHSQIISQYRAAYNPCCAQR